MMKIFSEISLLNDSNHKIGVSSSSREMDAIDVMAKHSPHEATPIDELSLHACQVSRSRSPQIFTNLPMLVLL